MSEWKSVPLYGIAKPKQVINCADRELLSVYLGKGVVPFSSQTAKRTNVTSSDLSKYQTVDYGDFVLNNQQAWRGSVGVSKYRGIVSPAYIVLALNDDISTDFANYLLQSRSMIDKYVVCSKGVGSIQRNIYWDYLKRIHLPLPPRAEQDQIVRFLDWKVSQTNRLINAKKKQAALLQEQKQTILNAAIPKTGEVVRFRHMFTLTKGLNITKSNLVESGVPCVSYGQIHSKFGFEVNPDIHQLPFVSESYLSTNPQSLMKYGDFVFADTSEDIAGAGNFTYLNSKTPAFAGYHTIIARTITKQNYRYIAYYLNSPQFRSQIQQQVNGVKVYSITRSILNNTTLILPSQDQQKAIVNMLDAQYSNHARLIEAINSEITLLHEYRIRLISDVVTGKMDVRSIDVPQYEVEEEIAEDEPLDDDIEEEEE